MTIREVSIGDIVSEDNGFDIRKSVFIRDDYPPNLKHAVRKLGIISPVTLFRNSEGILHLIDGRKRLEILREAGKAVVQARILPEDTPLEEVVNLIFLERRGDILSSVMNGAGFIHFATTVKIPDEWIFENLCMPLGFRPHRSFLQEVERIACLPGELRRFCHEKRYSLKQVLNLATYPSEILERIMAWKNEIQLSASTLDEIASNLKDYLRASGMSLDEFLAAAEIKEIFSSRMASRGRTEALRAFLRKKRFPTLTRVNGRIEETVAGLSLPEGVVIGWDRTLENRELRITVTIRRPEEWEELSGYLRSDVIKCAVHEILNEL
ncbi:hypothetical protein BMS3Bbin06_01324 [bacterium BMS3Bbin06]|nr:hypothetical protein BMS3Abin08_00643 [bacterium BMS3Abin08]GBE34794.1 hypothetical protein BMS3Bbin06_01324 [bacterium BMS3Bbin06]HDO34683.1 hypothetical protein [Nitrospirota bacterium]HDY72315.1 hypothetical protein [Nitrospirota bacterium]